MNLLDSFCAWLAATPASHTIKSVAWVVPAVQTVHILAVAAVITSALMINLQLLGVGGRERAVASTTSRFVSCLWWSLPVLLATGATLIIGEPSRVLKSPVFLLKMGLLIAAVSVMLVWRTPLQGGQGFWDLNGRRRWAVRCIAAVSLSLWVAIIFAGRWIAYVQDT